MWTWFCPSPSTCIEWTPAARRCLATAHFLILTSIDRIRGGTPGRQLPCRRGSLTDWRRTLGQASVKPDCRKGRAVHCLKCDCLFSTVSMRLIERGRSHGRRDAHHGTAVLDQDFFKLTQYQGADPSSRAAWVNVQREDLGHSSIDDPEPDGSRLAFTDRNHALLVGCDQLGAFVLGARESTPGVDLSARV